MDETLWITIHSLQGTNQPKVQTQRAKIALEVVIPMKHLVIKSHSKTRGWGVGKIPRGLRFVVFLPIRRRTKNINNNVYYCREYEKPLHPSGGSAIIWI